MITLGDKVYFPARRLGTGIGMVEEHKLNKCGDKTTISATFGVDLGHRFVKPCIKDATQGFVQLDTLLDMSNPSDSMDNILKARRAIFSDFKDIYIIGSIKGTYSLETGWSNSTVVNFYVPMDVKASSSDENNPLYSGNAYTDVFIECTKLTVTSGMGQFSVSKDYLNALENMFLRSLSQVLDSRKEFLLARAGVFIGQRK